MGERGSCGPSHPLDQPPTANPPPIVLSDTGTDAPENSGTYPHWVECLGPLPAGLSEGVRNMGVRLTPARAFDVVVTTIREDDGRCHASDDVLASRLRWRPTIPIPRGDKGVRH